MKRGYQKVLGAAALAVVASLGIGLSGASENILDVFSLVDIPNIDPGTTLDGIGSETVRNLYDPLLREVGEDQPIPWLAESLEVSDDARVWTFHLRPGVTFHDGSPVNAEAVRFTFNRFLTLNQGGVAFIFGPVMDLNSVQAIDDLTVQITLTKPFGPFLKAIPLVFIVNPQVVLAHEVNGDLGAAWLAQNEAGSGPFVIKNWQPGQLYEFTRYNNYWRGWEGPHLQGVRWRVTREAATRLAALRSGQADRIDWMTADDWLALQGDVYADPQNFGPQNNLYHLKLNNQQALDDGVTPGPLQDRLVRLAISSAFDYEALVQTAAQGFGRQPQGPLARTMPFHDNTLPIYTRDLEQARSLLTQAGWTDSNGDGIVDKDLNGDGRREPLEIDFVFVSGLDLYEQVGLIFQASLAEVGIQVNVVGSPWANIVAQQAAGPAEAWDAYYVTTAPEFNDPHAALFPEYHSSNAGSWVYGNFYHSPEVDRLLEEGVASADEARRAEIYQQVQRMIVEDAAEVFALEVDNFSQDIFSRDVCGEKFVAGPNAWFWYGMYFCSLAS